MASEVMAYRGAAISRIMLAGESLLFRGAWNLQKRFGAFPKHRYHLFGLEGPGDMIDKITSRDNREGGGLVEKGLAIADDRGNDMGKQGNP